MSIKWIYAKNYSPEGNGGEGKPNYSDWNDLFSDTETMPPTEPIDPSEEKKPVTPTTEIIDPPEKKESIIPPAVDEKKQEPEDIKAEAGKIKSRIDELKSKDEFKGKTDEELREIAVNEFSEGIKLDFGKEEKTDKTEGHLLDFTDVAKSIGITVDENEKIESVDVLKEKLSALTEEKVNKIKEEYSSYNELSEREKDLVHVLKNYGDKGLENYLNPSQKIDTYLSLEDQDLLEEDYKLTIGKDGNRLSEDEVADRLAEDIENGRVKEKADAIRNVLYIEKRKIQDNILIRAREESLNKEQKIIQSKMQEKETITSSLNSIKEIAPGVPMDDNIKGYILKSFESGEFEKTFKNPNDKIKSFIFAKKGDEIIKQISQAQYKKGKLDVLSRLDLTGSPQAGEAGKGSRTIADGGSFASWKMEG